MLLKRFKTPVDHSIRCCCDDVEIRVQIFPKQVYDVVFFEQNEIRSVAVHFEQQEFSFRQPDHETSFVLNLDDVHHAVAEHFGKEVDAIFAGAMKLGWKRKAAECRRERCLEKKTSAMRFETYDQLVFILAEAFRDDTFVQVLFQRKGKLT
jgi:hypothetical protein